MTRGFTEDDLAPSLASARVIVPLLLRRFPVRSVVDVGCGRGAWLRACQEAGVEVVLGLDGPYVDPATLEITPDAFRHVDLEAPFSIPGTFDLALCLEVVEHVTPRAGARIVEQLTRAASVVLFSAAVPGQVGTHHIHPRWPEYWASRFAARDYVALDIVRPRIWNHPEVAWWYQQNVWLYTRRDVAEAHPDLKPHMVLPEQVRVRWVHESVGVWPDLTSMRPQALLRALPSATVRALRRFVGAM